MSRAAAVVIALSLSAPCLAGVGPEILVPEDPRTPQVQVRPQVAYGGGVHLVVWQSGLGRKADMRTPRDLSRYFRDDVLRTARVQYAA